MQFDRLRRRDFITLLGGAAAAWPLAARAQQPRRMRRIGVLTPFPADDAEGHARLTAFTQAVQQSGWTVGQNVRMTIAGALAIPQLCASMQPNWSRLSRTSSWPFHRRHRAIVGGKPHRPNRVRDCCRPGWRRLCRDLGAAGRQYHWFHPVRIRHQ